MEITPDSLQDHVERFARGDVQALNALLEHYRPRLRRMVEFRLDPRFQGRIDASDVIQEGYLDAVRRAQEFARGAATPFYLWLRFLVAQQVQAQHRRHLGTQGRAAAREISLYRGAMPAASTAALAAHLLARLTTPSDALLRVERKLWLQEAVNAMDPIDCEILVLRHYEELTNIEAAAVLGLDKSAASKRYTRALTRLKAILTDRPGAGADLEEHS